MTKKAKLQERPRFLMDAPRRSKAKEERALIPSSLINRRYPRVTSFLHRNELTRPFNIRRTLRPMPDSLLAHDPLKFALPLFPPCAIRAIILLIPYSDDSGRPIELRYGIFPTKLLISHKPCLRSKGIRIHCLR